MNVAQAELIIAKQRMGPMGVTVYMGFQEKFARFENAFPESMEREFALAA
jgi:replicative DNA helicase